MILITGSLPYKPKKEVRTPLNAGYLIQARIAVVKAKKGWPDKKFELEIYYLLINLYSLDLNAQ